ncbi:MAG: hypothetical protein EAZ32_00410 [Cytophagia bacterium]|nr:MAG: hypothetical protein EAZ38_02835 [Cytophagales bacterium]TAG42935.1 MAG: hypothetical protein EAZ32_00410 [Cytophagia bacterium]
MLFCLKQAHHGVGRGEKVFMKKGGFGTRPPVTGAGRTVLSQKGLPTVRRCSAIELILTAAGVASFIVFCLAA